MYIWDQNLTCFFIFLLVTLQGIGEMENSYAAIQLPENSYATIQLPEGMCVLHILLLTF